MFKKENILTTVAGIATIYLGLYLDSKLQEQAIEERDSSKATMGRGVFILSILTSYLITSSSNK